MVSLLGTLDFGEKVTAIELGRIRTQDHYVRIEGNDRFHSFLVVARGYISRIAQDGDDLLPESIIGFHHQQFHRFRIHNIRFLGWCQTVEGFSSPKY